MRDDDNRLSAGNRLEDLLNPSLSLGIERTRWLVEDDDVRLLEDHTCERETLPLAARKLNASIADDGVISPGHGEYEFVSIRGPRGGLDLVPGCPWGHPLEIGVNAVVEEEDILRDVSNDSAP